MAVDGCGCLANVLLPRDYDTLLRRGYGDYMELPPPEQRRT